MDRLRKNGGTFGKALPIISQAGSRWVATGVLGVLGTLFAMLFTAGLFGALREKAPTRAHAVLLFGVLGSAGYALGSLTQWLGGTQVAAVKDQVAAGHAWIAVNALVTSFNG